MANAGVSGGTAFTIPFVSNFLCCFVFIVDKGNRGQKYSITNLIDVPGESWGRAVVAFTQFSTKCSKMLPALSVRYSSATELEAGGKAGFTGRKVSLLVIDAIASGGPMMIDRKKFTHWVVQEQQPAPLGAW